MKGEKMIHIDVPETCKICSGKRISLENGQLYCGNKLENATGCIDSIIISDDSRPGWCPLAEINASLSNITDPEKAKAIDNIITGMAYFFGVPEYVTISNDKEDE